MHGLSQKFRKNSPAVAEVELSERDQAIIHSMVSDEFPPAAFEDAPENSVPVLAEDNTPGSPANDFDFEIQVDEELEMEPVSSERDEDEPMLDAPWPSLHDAEANLLEPVEHFPEAQPSSPPVVQRKRKIDRAEEDGEPAPMPKEKKYSEHQVVDTDACFAGLKPVRALKKVQNDWFDPDALPVSVPYGVRYYLMPEDGTPVVSASAPEKPGRRSVQPPGTLFEDGSIVNPKGKVERPENRRANAACELCRLR